MAFVDAKRLARALVYLILCAGASACASNYYPINTPPTATEVANEHV